MKNRACGGPFRGFPPETLPLPLLGMLKVEITLKYKMWRCIPLGTNNTDGRLLLGQPNGHTSCRRLSPLFASISEPEHAALEHAYNKTSLDRLLLQLSQSSVYTYEKTPLQVIFCLLNDKKQPCIVPLYTAETESGVWEDGYFVPQWSGLVTFPCSSTRSRDVSWRAKEAAPIDCDIFKRETHFPLVEIVACR